MVVGEGGPQGAPEDVWATYERVRWRLWLLTNRKHGGKTKSVSVLKAALKNGGMEGENRKVGC